MNQPFDGVYENLAKNLLYQPTTSTGWWQSTADVPQFMDTRELLDVTIHMPMPGKMDQWIMKIDPNLPWAEVHFQERVSWQPLNPPPSSSSWPYAVKDNQEHKVEEKFSHTYPERIWPRFAGDSNRLSPQRGIRFEYGDLFWLVEHLNHHPGSRQAYLPIWFPEDTGVIHEQRVPCTLGYHFIIRNTKLHLTYYMRSCDIVRYMRDDVYMAGRLAQWVADKLNYEVETGHITIHIVSLHCFEGDVPLLERMINAPQ